MLVGDSVKFTLSPDTLLSDIATVKKRTPSRPVVERMEEKYP